MQWLGGIGIVVMAITILPLLKVGGMQLFKMEGPDSTEKILPRTIEVAAIIISTYIILTFFCSFFSREAPSSGGAGGSDMGAERSSENFFLAYST